MNRQVQLANSLLWASAIVASKTAEATTALILLVLLSLAAAAWVVFLVRSNQHSTPTISDEWRLK